MRKTQIMAIICMHLIILFPVYTVNALTISNVKVTSEGNSAVITWDTDEPADSDVKYGSYNNLDKTVSDSGLVVSHELAMTSLESASQYFFDVTSKYTSGANIFSDTKSGAFWTKDITPPDKITGLVNSTITQNSISMIWDKSNATDFSKYLIYKNGKNINNLTSIASTQFTDTGLASSTNYKYKVAAIDTSSNIGAKSDELSATTPEPDLTAPIITNAKITALTSTTATFSWETNENSNSTVYYGESSSYTSSGSRTESTLTHTITITGIEDKKLYYYQLSSCDSDGNCGTYDDSFVAGASSTTQELNINCPQYHNDHVLHINGATKPYSEVRFYINDVYKGFIGREKTGENGIIDFDLSGFSEGSNTLKVSSKDGAGKTKEISCSITIDIEPPQYEISEIPDFSEKDTITINGSANEPVKIEIYVEKGKTDTTAPSQVSNLRKGSVKENSIEILWDKNSETDIKTYAIYRDGVMITSYQDNKFVDPGVSTDKEYSYKVSAVDNACNEGEKSDTLKVKTKSGGKTINTSTSSYKLTCGESIEPITSAEYSTKFKETINLEKGLNNIKIKIIDIAGNTVEIKKQVYFDDEKPSILAHNLYELNPSYISDVKIYGKVSENATVFVLVNDNGTETGIIDAIKNKTIDQLSKITEYSAKTDSDGVFSVDIKLKRDPAIAYGANGEPLSVQSTATSASYWLNDIKIFAVDSVGLKSEMVSGEIKFAICGSGNDWQNWQINIGDVLPVEVVPRHLIEGFAQIGFNLEFKWMGIGNESNILDADVSLGYPMTMNAEMKELYDDEWVANVDDRWSDDKRQGYTVINFKKIDPSYGTDKNWTIYEMEKNLSQNNKGKCFKAGLGFGGEQIFSQGYIDGAGCVKVPLTIEVEYPCEQYVEKTEYTYTRWIKETIHCRQKQCLDIDVMIQPRIPPSVIPSSLLENSISVLNATINAIDAVLKPIKTATEIALLSCVALWVVWFVKRASEFFSCALSGAVGTDIEGCYKECEYKGEGNIACENGDDEKFEKCSDCLQSKLSSQKVWWLLRWTCDRVMCPSVPSFEKFIEDNDKEDEFCYNKKEATSADYITGEILFENTFNKNKIYEDIKTGTYEEDEDCKELLDKPLKNQMNGICCDEYYMGEWDSGCAIMNELKESGCLYTRNSELCGETWGNIFRGVADFNLCYGNKTQTIEMEVDGQWFIMEKEGEFQKKFKNTEEYDTLDNWNLYLGQGQRRIEKDKDGNTLSESVKVAKANDNIILKTEKGWKGNEKGCEKIMEGKSGYEYGGTNWPKYIRTQDRIIIIKDGKEEGDKPDVEVRKGEDYIPNTIVQDICSGVSRKDYIVDPTAGLIRATQCGCLSAVYAYLKHYREILNLIRNCFQTILLTGDGSAGVCRAVISYYICDMIYYAIKCIKEYSGAGYGKDVKGGISGFIKYVAGSGSEVANKVTGRYGDTNLFRVMFVEKKVIHAACLFAFTGDWSLDLESLFASAVEIPIKSTVVVAPSTRRFMSYDITTGYATHIYHLGVLIVSGADDLRYNIQLMCSNDNSCSPADGYPNGRCDCAYGNAAQPYTVTGLFGTGRLDSGETLNEEKFVRVGLAEGGSAKYRYDKAKITYTYKGNDNKAHTEEHIVDIRQIGGEPPVECRFDIADPSYKCGIGIGVYKGSAWFDDFPEADDELDKDGKYEKKLYLGSEISPFKFVVKTEGQKDNRPIKKWLTFDLRNKNGEKVHSSQLEIQAIEKKLDNWPNFKIEKKHFEIISSSQACDHLEGDLQIDEEKSTCNLNVRLEYEKGKWNIYRWSGNKEKGYIKGNPIDISCIESEKSTITCGKDLVVYLKTETRTDGSYVVLDGTQRKKKTEITECEDTPETWTATYELHYPKVDTSGNILNQMGSTVVYDGIIQKKTVDFDVYCKKGEAKKEEAEVDNKLTKEYWLVVEGYIKKVNGIPNDWKIDKKGNFLCFSVNGCSFDDAEYNEDYFNYLQTFTTPGGELNNREKNIAALKKLLNEYKNSD